MQHPPGPFAMTSFMRPVEHYRDRPHLAEAFVPAINEEIRRLAEAGADVYSSSTSRPRRDTR